MYLTAPRRSWTGRLGRIGPATIKSLVPDYQNPVFYISGSRSRVDSFKDTLHTLGIPGKKIISDYFAGLA
jgi:hypothetical protein